MARPMQCEQQPTAHPVPQRPVRLHPAPRLAQLDRQCPTGGRRIVLDQHADEVDIVAADLASSMPQYNVHAAIKAQTAEERKPYFSCSRDPILALITVGSGPAGATAVAPAPAARG